MPVFKTYEKVNVWEKICQDFSSKKLKDKTLQSEEFDPRKHNPVFYGHGYLFSNLDDEKLLSDFDSSSSHPACFGYGLMSVKDIEPKRINEKIQAKKDKSYCYEREYVESVIFPILLPCLERMLETAKLNKCFEKKRSAFNACDFITEYLYKNNPNKSFEENAQRKSLSLWEIPFVKDWLLSHPRPPIPKSLIWSDEEAALVIQSFYRGYLVRRDPEVQELRKWQKELREENQNIIERVEEFWNNTSSANQRKSNTTLDIFTSDILTHQDNQIKSPEK